MLTLHRFDAPANVDLAAIFAGLRQSPAHLPFYLFYDERGSTLFQQITQTNEYYLTRCEKQILQRAGAAIAQACGKQRVWFEPGAGCCDKAICLLQHASPKAYAAMDISVSALENAVTALTRQLPELAIHLIAADFSHGLPALEPILPVAPRTVFYPGSSIGNFTPLAAQQWLMQLATVAGDNGQLLLGFDLPKDRTLLHAAYNDADRITEAFHLNVLRHLQQLGVTVNEHDFAHLAFYNEAEQRIEMHLRCLRNTALQWQQQRVELTTEQTIVTEYSYKYSLERMQQIARQAGWQLREQWTDDNAWFALALFDKL